MSLRSSASRLSVRLQHPEYRSAALLLLIILAAFAIRVYRLDHYSLRGDESFTVLFVQKPLAQMWAEIRTVEPNPPLMYFALRGWVMLVGDGEFATRYFSVFWGALAVALLYRLAREIFGPPFRGGPARARGAGFGVALAASFILAINPYQVWHSQDVRNYTLWPALSLLALIFFWQWRNRVKADGRAPLRGAGALWPFVVAELAALYTHYYEVFILLALNLYVLFFLARRLRAIRRSGLWTADSPVSQWIGAQAALALLYLPFPLLLSDRVTAYGEGSGQQGIMLWDIWQRTFTAFTLGETLPDEVRTLGWIPLAAALLLILAFFWRREQRGVFFLLYAGVPTLAIFVLNLARPLYLERYLNGIAPAYYLLFAYSLRLVHVPRGRWIPYALLAFLSVLSLFGLANYFANPAYAKSPDWRGLARVILAGRQPGDVILQNFPETSLVYYTGGRMPLVVYPQEFVGSERTVPPLNNLNYKYRRVWFVPAAPDMWDPEHFVETFLDRHDDAIEESNAGSFRLGLYETPANFLTTMRPAEAAFGDWLTLKGYRLRRSGDRLGLTLYWQVRRPAGKSYAAVIDQSDESTGRVMDSATVPLLSVGWPTSEWRKGELLVDPHEFAVKPEANILSVGLVNKATGLRLPVSAAGRPAADAYLIPLSALR
ncbi:MAG: hypothetical protein ACM3JD_16170 [Rudaea sp.]